MPKKKAGSDEKKKTKQVKRTAKIKEVQKEMLRERLAGAAYINNLIEVEKDVDIIIETLSVCATRRTKISSQVVEKLKVLDAQRWLLKDSLEAQKVKADLNFKRLRFVLPELKAIEITNPSGKDPFTRFADIFAELHGDEEDSE